jgi:peptidoglycan-N-acetylglucosamine deacetylase
MKIFSAFLILIAFYNSTGQNLKWPGDKKSVIILTYDDALTSQLNVAVPQLNKYRLKGTFFLDGRIAEEQFVVWKAVGEKGHELANHSLYHPCSRNAFKNRERLYAENYDLISIVSEIKTMNKFLFLLDGKKEHTYAYPCTETSVGGKDYVDTLRSTGLIKYARVGGSETAIVTSTSKLDLLRVPSFGVMNNEDGDALIRYVNNVNKSGGVGIFMFHGVAGDYLSVTGEAHEKLLRYLKEHEKEIWVATFEEAMAYIDKNR